MEEWWACFRDDKKGDCSRQIRLQREHIYDIQPSTKKWTSLRTKRVSAKQNKMSAAEQEFGMSGASERT